MKLIHLFIILLQLPQVVFGFQLEEASITEVQNAIREHQLTCEQLVTAYIERIKKFDLSVTDAPPINALTEINRSALDDARQKDNLFEKTNTLSGPLHCIPIILKDNIDSFDTTTTAGSYALLGNQPSKDAFLSQKLRDAGAIILGKGGMDEFAWGMMGISSRNGRIGNAYNPNKNPGGSSGGPAAAVSANFAMAGIGSDNSGSVRIPAVFNGLIGLRPSTGLISQSGLFPMGKIDGVAGPMTRTVSDLAILLDVIAKPDPDDKKTKNTIQPQSYTAYLNKNGLHNKRIGIVRQVGTVDTFKDMPEPIHKMMQKAYTEMQNLGARFIEIQLIGFDTNREYNQAGEIQDINQYLNSYPATRTNFRDICESNRTRNFGTLNECLRFMKKMEKQTVHEIKIAKSIASKNNEYVNRMMQEKQLDALLIPISTQGIATYDGNTINTWRAPVSSNSGIPSIAFIIGYFQNMPVGVELIGKQFTESALIEMAYAYEQHMPKRQVPKMPKENKQVENMSIAQFNNVINQLGKEAYEHVLKQYGNDENKLTAKVFQKLTQKVLNKE
ncbi:amidase [Legionella bononiensis]|uniref:Amidase n=1 Tax=Legionella bononiensis TaxID=2793102 RepID=A0ABS1WDJ1_9GAMM|nr:amidase family protein [Legionella bononiensis]MBL7481394.1 amidase [Legionella bononiensis]MBL7527426.1 amidase [Legionella bononiensis]